MSRVLACIIACVLVAVAVYAAPATDRATEKALDQIDEIKVNRQRHEVPGHEVARPRVDPNKIGRWSSLLRLAGNFWPTLLVGAAMAIAGGVAGSFVLLRREALAALAMPQIVAGGGAGGVGFNWPALPPALIAGAGGVADLGIARGRGGGA